MLYVCFDDILVYCSKSGTKISYCPKRFFLSPVETFEMGLELFLSEYCIRTSSFEELNNIWDWMDKRNAEVDMYVIFFHTYSDWINIEFPTYSFKYLSYLFLKRFYQTLSSVFRYPYYMISTVIDCMRSLSVRHIAKMSVLYTLDTLVIIGLKANGVLDPRVEIMKIYTWVEDLLKKLFVRIREQV